MESTYHPLDFTGAFYGVMTGIAVFGAMIGSINIFKKINTETCKSKFQNVYFTHFPSGTGRKNDATNKEKTSHE